MDFLDLWIPGSAAELELALADGNLREDHFRDAKRELGPKANQGLAIDLASFAVDGGLLFIGVEEAEGRFSPAPVEILRLRERVEQIAGSLVDPPLRVETRALPLEADPEHGYLVVLISPSPSAPHAVDGVYRGRGDSANRRLPDIEVRRIRAERERGTAGIDDLLDAEIRRDPMPGKPGHLFIVAEPEPARRGMLMPLLGAHPGRTVQAWVAATPRVQNFRFCADFSDLNTVRRRADGWGVSTYAVGPGRTPSNRAEDDVLLDLEILEGGGLRLFSGCGSVPIRGPLDGEQLQGIVDHQAWVLVWRVVELAGRLSREAHFLGNWRFGVAMTDIRGMSSYQSANPRLGRGWEPYSADSYRETTTATSLEAAADPTAVGLRLVGRLLRSVTGNEDHPAFQGFP